MALCLLYEVLRQKFCFFATHNVCNSQINEGAESRVNRVAVVSRRGTGRGNLSWDCTHTSPMRPLVVFIYALQKAKNI